MGEMAPIIAKAPSGCITGQVFTMNFFYGFLAVDDPLTDTVTQAVTSIRTRQKNFSVRERPSHFTRK